jgi:hypothetical protein
VTCVAACSGASATEMFAGEPSPIGESNATEPEPEPEPGPDAVPPARPIEQSEDASAPATKDAAAKDSGQDAGQDTGKADAGGPVTKCSFDSDCQGDDVCNWKTDICAAPGPIGAACKRDVECTDGLCNWKLEKCSEPAPSGTACRRNKECASGACGASLLCK